MLAVDLGTKRVGVAVSDALGLGARPLRTIQREGNRKDAEKIAALVVEYEVTRVVIGLPLALSGEVGPRAKQSQDFARVVGERLGPGVPVELWDERFSTVEAENAMRRAGLSARRRRSAIDEEAACVILNGWLDARRA